MADDIRSDRFDKLAALLRLDDVGEGVPMRCALITKDCIPHPRWQARREALAAGQEWNWQEQEISHLSRCAFCRRREQFQVAASVPSIVIPPHNAPPQDAADTVAASRASEATIGSVFSESLSREERIEALVRPGVTDVVTRSLAQLSPDTGSFALKERVESAILAVWAIDTLPRSDQGVLWRFAALATASRDRSAAIILLVERVGLDDREIADVLGISERDVLKERLFAN